MNRNVINGYFFQVSNETFLESETDVEIETESEKTKEESKTDAVKDLETEIIKPTESVYQNILMV